MSPTNGRRPKTGERLLRVKFRNGHISIHAYRADQLRWDHRGSDWDIIEVGRA
jgi:hypothetical protein